VDEAIEDIHEKTKDFELDEEEIEEDESSKDKDIDEGCYC